LKGFFKNTIIGFLVVIVCAIGVLWFVGNEAKKDGKLVFDRTKKDSSLVNLESGAVDDLSSSDINKTDEIAREIYINYISDTTNKKPNDVIEEEIVDMIKNVSLSEVSAIKTYTINDIKIVDSTEDLLLLYEKSLKSISDTYVFEGLGTEPDILKKITADNTTAKEKELGIKELKRAEDAYKGIRDALLKTTVPSKLVSRHIELINIYERFAVSVSLMQKAESDRIYTVPATKLFVEALKFLFLLETR